MGNGRKRGMGRLADRTAERTDEALTEREAAVLRETLVDWEALRPKLGDPATLDRLVAVVQEASARNESLAQFQVRVRELGEGAVVLAKRVCRLLS